MTILWPHTNRIYSMRKFSSGLKENANGNNISQIFINSNLRKDEFRSCNSHAE